MLRRACHVSLAVLLVALAVVAGGSTRPVQAAAVKIMPLGDSITGSPGCWRALLWNRLQGTGFTNIDFVGTQPPQGCGVPYDGDNEGHGGLLATNLVSQNLLPGFLSATSPDIVLMHLGTNDVWGGQFTTGAILDSYTTLVGQMRASNPSMRILVAQILPMNPANCTGCEQRVEALNQQIPAWASAHATAQSPVTVVDQWTGFVTSTDTTDGVHPNAAGDQKMSDRWYPALSALLTPGGPAPSPSGTPTPTPAGTPSPTPTPTATPTPTGPGGCGATYRIVNQWQGAFQGEVTVANQGTSSIAGWTVRFGFANGQQVTQSWSGTLTQSGANVTVTNLSWNGSLGPNASTTFGFVASWSGTNAAAAPTCAAS
jgi:lysophospholipase L1-like esterase